MQATTQKKTRSEKQMNPHLVNPNLESPQKKISWSRNQLQLKQANKTNKKQKNLCK
jgi:hypothetical protein